MTTVTISGNVYPVYVAPSDVDIYAGGSMTASAWEALVPDDKARAVVTVTRWIDSECWQGDKVDPAQPLAWPRTIGDYLSVIVQAAISLSILVAANPDLPDQLTGHTVPATDGGTRILKAGTVTIEYFRNLNFLIGSGVSPFPRNVMNMIAQWLCGSTGLGTNSGSDSFDTCNDTYVGDRERFDFIWPFS